MPVELRRIDPAKNMHRFYRLDVQPDLFGGVLLMKEWGRIGAHGRMVAWSPSVTTPRLLPSTPCSVRPNASRTPPCAIGRPRRALEETGRGGALLAKW